MDNPTPEVLTILDVPLWIWFFVAVIYWGGEFLSIRRDMRWHDDQKKRHARIAAGEELMPLPPYISSSGAMYTDVAVFYTPAAKQVRERCRQIVELQKKIDARGGVRHVGSFL